MLQLFPPSESQIYYLWERAYLGLVGELDFSQAITYRSDREYLLEFKGICGENDVENLQFNGQLVYNAGLLNYTDSPTSQYPQRKLFTYRTSTGQTTTAYAEFGIIIPGQNFLVQTYQNYRRGAYQLGTSMEGVIRKIRSLSYQPYYIDNMIEYYNFSVNSNGKVIANYRAWSNSSFYTGKHAGVQWSLEDLFNLTFPVSGTTYTEGIQVFDGSGNIAMRFPLSISTSNLLHDVVERLKVIWDIYLPSIPQQRHYGDLAIGAVQQVSRLNVNVIELLKDLRHPSQMIPKLKNLKKLKTLADNFLTLKYAILPTISDLSEIVSAMNKRVPYLDRNGYSTYSNGYTETNLVDTSVSVKLEQHIKVAVGNDDSDLEKLSQGMEKLGIFPDLKTIWELIPYSFVIDWFVGVGNLLERIDFGQRTLRYDIRYTTSSYKYTMNCDISKEFAGLTGTAQRVHYHRWTSDQCPVPLMSLQTPDGFNHWLEAAALIVQRRK